MLNTSTHQERLNQLFYNQVSENSLNLAIKDAVNEKNRFLQFLYPSIKLMF